MRAVLAAVLALAAGARAEDYDLVIRNGRVVDGAGAPWRRADVAVRGDTIVAIAASIPGSARRVVDAGGRVVAPGFLDLHTHARRGIFEVPSAVNYVRQGVTTLVEGPDGSSALPLGPFLDKVQALGPGVNFASLVGHGSIREAVLGRANRAPTAAELVRMQELVRQAMRQGAFGLSTGLFYVPGSFARTDEVVALARVAGELGGIHTSHMRDEAALVLESVKETIAIGEEGQLPTQVTHHKMIGRSAWGRSVESLRLVQQARERGVDVTIDQYPYTASSTALEAALLPAWALEGGAGGAARSPRGSPGARAHPRGRDGQDPQRARGRRPAQHQGRGLRLRPRARGPDARRHPARPESPAHDRQRRRARARDRRAGRRLGGLPRHLRGGPRAHPGVALHHDRLGRRDPGLRPGRTPPAQLRHLRARAGGLRPREGPARPSRRRSAR